LTDALAANQGSFNTFLSIFALQFGASGLVGASASPIVTKNKGPSSGSHSSSNLISLQSTAGIAIAALVIVCILICSFIALWIIRRGAVTRGASPYDTLYDQQQANTTTSSIHDAPTAIVVRAAGGQQLQ